MRQGNRARTNIFDLQPLEVRRFLTTASITANNTLTITGTGSGETITVNRNSSNRVAITGVSATFVSGSGSGQFNKIVINAQGGSDTITISGNVGSSIPSTINAGDGNDVIATGLGDDVIFGQNGFDTVNYSARTSKVTVSLDGAQNDGETQNGESDNVNAEEVIGGSGNDVFTGNSSANFFGGGSGNDEMAAGGGNDELVGSTGNDALFGEGGDDALYAKNNDVDTVNGGTGPSTPDLDLAEVDGVDVSASVQARLAARDAALQAALTDPSALDTTYGGNDTGLNSGPDLNWNQITAAVMDAQGGMIIVGSASHLDGDGDFGSDFVVTRYHADGTHDDTFGFDGETIIDFTTSGAGYNDDDQAFGVTIDADGNIIVVGTSRDEEAGGSYDFAICRLSSTGDVDTDFGTHRYDIVSEDTTIGGNGRDVAHDVTVQADGKIVVVGSSDLDVEFGGGDVAIIRLDEFGDLDAGFNDATGMNTLNVGTDEGVAVAMQTAGESVLGIVVGGTSDGDFLLARFALDGELDTTFGESAGYSLFSVSETSFDVLNDIAVNPTDGDIVAVGQSVEPIITFALNPIPQLGAVGVLAGFHTDGTLGGSATYGIDGDEVSFNAVAYDPTTNGMAVVGSTGEEFVVAKFSNVSEFAPGFDGLVLTDFTPDGDSEWNDVALGVGVLADGRMVVGGYSDTCGDGCIQTSVARYGTGGEGPIEEVEGFLSFDDVQDDRGNNRSALATFYLKSTHLDDDGNAIINLTNNNDVVNISLVQDENGDDQVAVDVGGLVLYYDTDTTSITINCNNGNDVVTASNDVNIPLFINGGNGTDQLTGGGGGDVIVGGAGSDTTNGNNGNDILIGGASGDTQNGGAGEDIFVGGTTAYDNNTAALHALQAEWNSGGSNATRVNNIRNGGGLNDTFVLKVGPGATVFDDSSKDTYTGGNDRDWFFRRTTGGSGSRDAILDPFAGEELSDF